MRRYESVISLTHMYLLCNMSRTRRMIETWSTHCAVLLMYCINRRPSNLLLCEVLKVCFYIQICPITCGEYNQRKCFASAYDGCVIHVCHVLGCMRTHINHYTVGINYNMRHCSPLSIARGLLRNNPFVISSVYTWSRLTSPVWITEKVHVKSRVDEQGFLNMNSNWQAIFLPTKPKFGDVKKGSEPIFPAHGGINPFR